MKLFMLVTLAMCAFAGNSILTRFGVGLLDADPMIFAVIRIAAGAVTLSALVLTSGNRIPLRTKRRLGGALSLAAYVLTFSWAYLTLGAGLGALVLFGAVQLTMFAYAIWHRQSVPIWRWMGAAIAMIGLTVLLWPAGTFQVPLLSAAAMVLSGVAWGAYTLFGQGERDPLISTAGNFVLCLPLVLFGLLLADSGITLAGAFVAVLAGSVTSGLGYALWYRVLPQLPTTVAAIAQLSVPVIAVGAGIPLLAEPLTAKLAIAGALVLGGIAVSLVRQRT